MLLEFLAGVRLNLTPRGPMDMMIYRASALKILFILIALSTVIPGQERPSSHYPSSNSNNTSEIDTIENFDDGEVLLLSYSDQDINPAMWSLSNSITYNNSPFSLRLYGNTWKLEPIDPRIISEGEVWQVSAFIQTVAEIQGFGITDSINTLFYSFAGTEQLNIQEWITVYQGAFPNNTWNNYTLPVADDWFARFGYLPVVKGIIYVNDRDAGYSGTVYFDEIINITGNLPAAPEVSIQFTRGKVYKNNKGNRSVDVAFTSIVYDPDSETHDYLWNFGDSSTSVLANPVHTFIVEDDHQYTVLLLVTDPTGRTGTASCRITVDEGPTSFPVTMNFTGDIILARRIETLISQQGYQALIDPIAPYLGGAADITVVNLESPLTTSTYAHPTKPILLKGSPLNSIVLSYAGIDLATLANNHILDYGKQGLIETQAVVRGRNIIPFGAGSDSYEAMQPAFYSKSGLNFAFLGSSDRTGQYNNYQPYLDAGFNKPGFANLTEFNISSQINSVKDVSDIIIFQMHSGSEYSIAPLTDTFSGEEEEGYSPYYRNPSEGVREIRRYAIDAGADAVICHHPHIIHGFEVYNKKLIAHSLGNFIFDLDYPETCPSVILNAKVNASGIYNYTLTPVYIDDYIPQRARGELGLYILDDLAKRSKDLDTYIKVDKQNAAAEIILDSALIETNTTTVEEILTLESAGADWISQPVPLTRSGSISAITYVEPSASWKYRLGRQLVWFGNYEDEGCTLWERDNADEYYDTSEFYRGLRSFSQKRNAGQLPLNTNLEERLIIYKQNASYTLYSYIKKNSTQAAGAAVQLYETRTSTALVGSAEIQSGLNSVGTWAYYKTDFTVPLNGKYMNIRLRSEAPAAGTGIVSFDDTGVIEWTDWQEFSSSVQISSPNDFYWIQIKNNNNVSFANLYYEETSISASNPTASDITITIPEGFKLYQNYPNPFNASTTLNYDIPYTTIVKLKIYNILGEEVRTLINEIQSAGRKTVRWDGRDNRGREAGSGVYLYRLETSSSYLVKKLMILK